MKANKAPEKIYMNWVNYPLEEMQVEYTCTDDFIEKALAYLAVENNTFNCMEEMFEDFRKYMKGE